jgi:diketogulonate reductase-like aldo/keto reductase
MRTVALPSGESVPALGMGTWFLGDHEDTRAKETAALQCGIDLGLSLIDTAEMYGEGASERLVGSAIKGRRDKVFLVSKVYPHNASRRGTLAACERSLNRLSIDCIDLYLLHWRGNIPLSETVEAFQRLQRDGKIRFWGVSNFDLGDMTELRNTAGGDQVAVNQVLYNLSRRGIEWDLLPWCTEHLIPIMAYSPIEQARLLRNPALRQLAEDSSVTAAQLALAWLLSREQVIAIPKASTRDHVEQNFAAMDLRLDSGLRSRIDAIFPPPVRATPLEML